eukprot:s2525_g4.t1
MCITGHRDQIVTASYRALLSRVIRIPPLLIPDLNARCLLRTSQQKDVHAFVASGLGLDEAPSFSWKLMAAKARFTPDGGDTNAFSERHPE